MVLGTSPPSSPLAPVSMTTPRAAPLASNPPPGAAHADLSVALVGPTTYEVRRDDAVVGYIDIVGGVYVALAGPRYDHAVEVHQSIMLDLAVAALS